LKIVLFLLSLIFSLEAFSKDSACAGFYTRFYDQNSHFGLQVFKLNMDNLDKRLSSLKEKLNSIGIEKTASLAKPLSKQDQSKVLQKAGLFLKSDIRITFFKLQSLSRIYSKHYDDPFFDTKVEFFKKFEDLIGKVDLWHSMWTLAEKISEPRLQAYFLQLKVEAATSMLIEMENSGLIDNPQTVFNAHYKELKQFSDWKKPLKDLAIQYKQIAKELRKLDDKVKARTFTNDDIELGLHELRRRLRWPLIHIQVFNRLTRYETSSNFPDPVQALYHRMKTENPKLLTNGFLKMDPSDIESPILIPFIPYAMMTELVGSIGVQKDKAEGDLYFGEALSQMRFSEIEKTRVKAKILAATNRQESFDHKALSDRVQADLNASGLLRFFADVLERLNDQ
jgi:hypothetical protein